MATRRDTSTGRFYSIEGRELPSVTTVLSVIAKPALIKWAENTARSATIEGAADLYMDLRRTPEMSRAAYVTTLQSRLSKQRQTERELSRAAEIGSQTHALIEWTLRQRLGQIVGPRPATTPPAEWAFMAYEDWASSVNLEPLFIEQTLWSLTHGYAGTMDLLAKVNGRTTLIDFKTSKGIYAEYDLQNVAYQVALAEMGHDLPEGGGLIVRLPKTEIDPAFEVHPCASIEDSLPVFLSALRLWQWWHAAEQASRAAWKRKQGSAA